MRCMGLVFSRSFGLLGAAMFIAAICGSARGESVLNGGFSSGVLGSTSDQSVGQATNWTAVNVVYSPGYPDLNTGGWSDAGGDPGGVFFLNNTGHHPALADDPQIYQDIVGLVAGRTYTLSADYKVFPTTEPPAGGTTPDLGFKIDGNLTGVVLDESAGNTAWHHFSETFTYLGIAGNANRLTIFAEMNNGDGSALVDNISIAEVVPVPMPASVLSGMVLMGIMAARRMLRR
jgi:hypothetical protein